MAEGIYLPGPAGDRARAREAVETALAEAMAQIRPTTPLPTTLWSSSASDPLADLAVAVEAMKSDPPAWPRPDPLTSLREHLEQLAERRPFTYRRDPNMPAGRILVLGPQATGRDGDVYLIPAGEGDRILDAVRELGWPVEEWVQTAEELARVCGQFFNPIPFAAPARRPAADWLRHSGA